MSNTVTARTIRTFQLFERRRLLVVPVNISRSKRFMLAVQVESRNGCMYKLLPFAPFGEEQLPPLRVVVGKLVDIRIAQHGQAATSKQYAEGSSDNPLDAGQEKQAEDATPEPEQVECEACGAMFKPSEGYYEAEHEPTYSYCAQCCMW